VENRLCLAVVLLFTFVRNRLPVSVSNVSIEWHTIGEFLQLALGTMSTTNYEVLNSSQRTRKCPSNARERNKEVHSN